MAALSPYRTVEVRPGHLRHQLDHATSRALAADMDARERARVLASLPLWRKLLMKLAGPRGQ